MPMGSSAEGTLGGGYINGGASADACSNGYAVGVDAGKRLPRPQRMRYRSTRGGANDLTFEEAVFEGLASDGGLMVPEELPRVDQAFLTWRGLSFDEMAFEIARLFCGEEEIPEADLRDLMRRSYGSFTHEQTVPTRKVSSDPELHVMELFHGPTFAFKDVALQALGNLYEYFLARKSRRLTVLGATSGDTGSAAIYGLRGKAGVECFILFPEGRVSKIQEQQMTSVLDSNIHCIAVKGTFDDCQDIVKELFGDLTFKKEYGLGAVNSINWARIMFQITYYFYTYLAAYPDGDGTMSFSVPTGNFGDILAGYYAKMMGLPVRHLVVATNSNDILHRFFTTGVYDKHPVAQTCSPSMDIGISSNFERYLFDLFGQDAAVLAKAMADFKRSGKLGVDAAQLREARACFSSAAASEQDIMEAIKRWRETYDYVLDPHTACGVVACERVAGELGWRSAPRHTAVVLGTAHPAKFSEAVVQASGSPPEIPPALARLSGCRLRKDISANSSAAIRGKIERTLGGGRGGPMALCGCFAALSLFCSANKAA